jgi:DNA polymerase zeta
MPALGIVHMPTLPICEECIQQPELVLFALRTRRKRAEQRVRNVRDVCKSCSGLSCEDEIKCDSRDCPVLYTRVKEEAAFESMKERVDSVVETLEDQHIEKSLEW